MLNLKNWFLAVLLSCPLVFFLISHFYNHAPNLVATGFIQYDNVTYAGNAIQYTWPEHQGLFYANRLNDSHSYTQIYFNPQLIILALFIRMGLAPGLALMIFTFFSSVLFFRIVIGIYDQLKQSNQYRILNIILFCWGGGLLCLSGLFLYLIGITKSDFGTALFALDPAYGWWGLNAGRSLFFSMEACYHALFFAVILFILKKKWLIAVFTLVLLSLSHPFTGIELLLILFTWVIIETSINRKAIPIYFSLAVVLVLTFHIWYYLVYLNKFPEHLSVFRQYSLNWKYRFYHFIPAYILVACLTLIAKRLAGYRSFLSITGNRLFISWAAVAFALANHELLIKPMQPLHFTRGYIWSALFFAGLPALNYLWKNLLAKKIGIAFTILIIVIFLSDNFTWIVKNTRRVNEASSVTLITTEQKQILEYLRVNARYNDMIVGHDEVIPYLASIYTKSNIWISHPYNTPDYASKKRIYDEVIKTGQFQDIVPWYGRRCFFIIQKSDQKEMDRFTGDAGSRPVLETTNYLVYLKLPTTFMAQWNQ